MTMALSHRKKSKKSKKSTSELNCHKVHRPFSFPRGRRLLYTKVKQTRSRHPAGDVHRWPRKYYLVLENGKTAAVLMMARSPTHPVTYCYVPISIVFMLSKGRKLATKKLSEETFVFWFCYIPPDKNIGTKTPDITVHDRASIHNSACSPRVA